MNVVDDVVLMFNVYFARELSKSNWMLLTVPDQAVRGGYLLCFLDDGQGMSPGTDTVLCSEVMLTITF